jgi:hypothetical protein
MQATYGKEVRVAAQRRTFWPIRTNLSTTYANFQQHQYDSPWVPSHRRRERKVVMREKIGEEKEERRLEKDVVTAKGSAKEKKQS